MPPPPQKPLVRKPSAAPGRDKSVAGKAIENIAAKLNVELRKPRMTGSPQQLPGAKSEKARGAELPKTALDALVLCDRDTHKRIHTLLHILCTLPASNGSSERTFSTLCRANTWLRITMMERRLEGLEFFHVHYVIPVNPYHVIERTPTSAHYALEHQLHDVRTAATCSSGPQPPPLQRSTHVPTVSKEVLKCENVKCNERHLIVCFVWATGHSSLLTKPMRVSEECMEQRRNEDAEETGDPREDPPANGIIRHDSHMRKSGHNRRLVLMVIVGVGFRLVSDELYGIIVSVSVVVNCFVAVPTDSRVNKRDAARVVVKISVSAEKVGACAGARGRAVAAGKTGRGHCYWLARACPSLDTHPPSPLLARSRGSNGTEPPPGRLTQFPTRRRRHAFYEFPIRGGRRGGVVEGEEKHGRKRKGYQSGDNQHHAQTMVIIQRMANRDCRLQPCFS
ncbi:hypothetical protein PR048_006717 [Dryococelus australis]|uniref:Uncharacterized protein n=1 Tax=Dryococelus australis TaxID=614101 RepID=A0ABQ9IBQ1_9NEOP|nr:hypothetical protein PR048_006717 [Dryococelus australis]